MRECISVLFQRGSTKRYRRGHPRGVPLPEDLIRLPAHSLRHELPGTRARVGRLIGVPDARVKPMRAQRWLEHPSSAQRRRLRGAPTRLARPPFQASHTLHP